MVCYYDSWALREIPLRAELSGYQERNDISFLPVENYRGLNRVS